MNDRRHPSVEHAPENAMEDISEIKRFHDRCSDLMRELLDALAEAPGRPRTFPEVEDAMGWPHRRIASVLGGVSHLRHTEFAGRRPYRFLDGRRSASGRWEIWMDSRQARAVRATRPHKPDKGTLGVGANRDLERQLDQAAGPAAAALVG